LRVYINNMIVKKNMLIYYFRNKNKKLNA